MRISSAQQRLIVNYEFGKFLMVGSGGKIELARPMPDDELRDYKIHIRGEYGMEFACQVKSAMSLHKMSKGVRSIKIVFDVSVARLVNSVFYWYFVAYLDPKTMGLADPTFLIPSEDFHRLADPIQQGGLWRFSMAASMEPKSRDPWSPYRVGTLELGERVLEISRELKRTHPGATLPAQLLAMPEVLVVRA